MDFSLLRLLCPWDSPGKNTGVGCHFLLQLFSEKTTNNPKELQVKSINRKFHRRSNLNSVKNIKFNNTVEYYFALIWLAKIKKPGNAKNWGKLEKQILSNSGRSINGKPVALFLTAKNFKQPILIRKGINYKQSI